jgi:ABC-type uncharacterized transport system substrate-binding protein
MDRRAFLATMTGGLFAVPLPAGAQPSGRVARVGVLGIEAASLDDFSRRAFLAALKDLGWLEGQNLVFEGRYAAGQSERLPALATELVRLKVDMIVTVFNQETLAAQQVTSSIPIVMLRGIYPEQAGLVASLATQAVTSREPPSDRSLVGRTSSCSKRPSPSGRGSLSWWTPPSLVSRPLARRKWGLRRDGLA